MQNGFTEIVTGLDVWEWYASRWCEEDEVRLVTERREGEKEGWKEKD